MDVAPAPATPTTELDPFSFTEVTAPAPAADLDPFAGVNDADADSLATLDAPEASDT